MKGLIHLYEGDGKGKSTAALGLCMRCAGSRGKVIYTQFLKDNQSSELSLLKTISEIQFIPCKKTFGFYPTLSPEQKAEARQVYQELLMEAIDRAVRENCRMLVLDEIVAADNYQLIDSQYLLDFLKNKPEMLEVVMTGRNPSKELIALADYVSDIKKIKHPYDNGIGARLGIEK